MFRGSMKLVGGLLLIACIRKCVVIFLFDSSDSNDPPNQSFCFLSLEQS